MPRTSRFLVSTSLALGVVALSGQAAFAGPRAPVPGGKVTVTASVPLKASVHRSFTIDLAVSGEIAGLQAQVMLDQKAAEVGGVIPVARKSKALSPVMNQGGARIGAYGARAFTDGKFLRIAIFPRKAGRLTSTSAASPRSRRRAAACRSASRRARTPSRSAAPSASSRPRRSRPPSRVASLAAPIQADLDRNGIVTRQDLFNTSYGWSAGTSAGDVDGNGRVDVSDMQTVLARVRPEPKQLVKAAPMVFTVDTTTDTVDATPGNKICANTAGLCTLRAALDEANRNPGPDTVAFNIPGPAPQVIQLSSGLGRLIVNQSGTTIDGYTQPGSAVNTDPVNSNALPGIEIRGNGNAAKEAIFVTNLNTTIRGLALNRMWRHIWLTTGSGNTTVSGNLIGMTALGASVGTSGQMGVLMDGGSHDNLIGLPTLEGRNVIAAVSEGVDHISPGTDRNVTRNNIIGLSPNGVSVYQIGDNGIDFNFGPKNNTIGGFGPLEKNVIAGASNSGVELSHGWNQALAPREDTSLPWQINDNKVLGNWIGFNTAGLYNSTYAVGRCFPGCETNDNGQGVNVIDGTNRTIVDGNTITGLRSGVAVTSPVSQGNIVRNNVIGTSPLGAATTINRYGVWLTWQAQNNTVQNNQIANTGWAGIGLDQSSVYDNLISMNTMKNVGYPGIDMFPMKQVNINGTQPGGADHAVFYPVITAATTTSVSGTAPANAIVEVYRSTNDPGLHGPGESFVGSTVASGAGAWSLAATLSPGAIVTATATTYGNINTSEYGPNVAVPGANPDVHGVTFSSWTGRTGTALTSIPVGTVATTSSRIARMQAPTDRGDNLGTRLQALLTAPATGSYTFWIASDDTGRLLLSNSADPAGRTQIARVDSFTASEEWDKFPAQQQSAPVNLVAGQQYYIEAWAKEGTGGDNLAVAWSGPSISRQVIPGDALAPTSSGCGGWCPAAPVAPTNALLQTFTAGRCLDVSGASTTPGTAAIQFTCTATSNQRWTLTAGGAMQVYGNRCLSPLGGLIVAGTPVVIDNCALSAAQTWTYTAANRAPHGRRSVSRGDRRESEQLRADAHRDL